MEDLDGTTSKCKTKSENSHRLLRSILMEDPEDERVFKFQHDPTNVPNSSITSPNHYDSGHFSSSNVSETRPSPLQSVEEDDDGSVSSGYIGNNDRIKDVIRERNQALSIALKDVRKLQSELERFQCSADWYKNELRNQKKTNREIVEKLHTNKRNYLLKEQRLRKEYAILQTHCTDVEKLLNEESQKCCKTKDLNPNTLILNIDTDFTANQQKAIICDQEKLIDFLRKQRQTLIDDLKRLNTEHDDKIVNFQNSYVVLEKEDKKITSHCMELSKAKEDLEQKLKLKDLMCNAAQAEINQLQQKLSESRKEVLTQLNIVKEKEQNICKNQREYKSICNDLEETQALTSKQQVELSQIKNENIILQGEISTLEQKLNLIKELESLKPPEVEVATSQDDPSDLTNINKSLLDYETLKTKFSDICMKYEQVQFKLDLQKIALRKLEFEKQVDKTEILDLREKIKCFIETTQSMQKEIRNLNQSLNDKNESELVLRETIELQKVEIDKINEEFLKSTENFQNDKKVLETQVNEKEKEILVLSNEKFLTDKQISELQLNIEKCTTENTEYISQIKNLEKNIISSKETNETLSKKFIELEEKHLNDQKRYNISFEPNNEAQYYNTKSLVEKKLNDDSTCTKLPTNSTTDQIKCTNKSNSPQENYRIQNIQMLIEERALKVHQLTTDQTEWEQLLTLINNIEFKRAESIADDSLEYDNNILKEDKILQETDDEKQTFQIEFNVMRERLQKTEQKFNESNKKIERLTQEFSDDLSRERESAKNQKRLLLSQITQLKEDKSELKNLVKQLTCKNSSANTDSTIFPNFGNISPISSIHSQNSLSSDSKSCKELRIFRNVVESETQRKIARYVLYIRTLLNKLRSLKRDLTSAENRCANLLLESNKNRTEIEEHNVAQRKLCEMQQQLEQSRKTIKILESKLQSTHTCNVAATSRPVIEVSNLMDDYKKLIQESCIKPNDHDINAIYDLIKRSNEYAPNLNKLSNVVGDLREDIEKYITISTGRTSPTLNVMQTPVVSLMDELQAAELRTIHD